MPVESDDVTRSAQKSMTSTTQLPSIEEAAETASIASDATVASSVRTRPLTISKKEKEDAEFAKSSENSSAIASALKWTATGLLGLSLLGCLVASKLSLIRLTQSLKNACGEANDYDSRVKATRIFLMVVMTLVIPASFNFVRAVWIGGGRSDMPWPKKRAILLVCVRFVKDIQPELV